MSQNKVSILGSGSFGSSIALVVASQVEELFIWCRRREIANEINTKKTNKTYLKSNFPPNIKAYTDINAVVNASNIIIIAIPGNFLEETLKKIDLNNKIVISLVKSVFINETGNNILTCCELIERRFADARVLCWCRLGGGRTQGGRAAARARPETLSGGDARRRQVRLFWKAAATE